MYLVAIAWIYVVLMMAIVEALSPNGTVLGAVFTFALYGALPLSIVLYVMGTPGRRQARKAAEAAELEQQRAAARQGQASDAAPADGTEPGGAVGQAGSAATVAPPGASPSAGGVVGEPDAGGHAAGQAVAPVRKEA